MVRRLERLQLPLLMLLFVSTAVSSHDVFAPADAGKDGTATTAQAAGAGVSVVGRVVYPAGVDPATTTIQLFLSAGAVSSTRGNSALEGAYMTWTRADGGFVFDSVAPGAYYLDIADARYSIDGSVRIDISGKSGTIKAKHVNDGGRSQLAYPLRLDLRPVQYFAVRQGFNPMTLLKSPMIMMIGVSLLMTVGLPKLMNNLDPETKAEIEAQQKGRPMVDGKPAPPAAIEQNFTSFFR